MKIISVILVALTLTGCGWFERKVVANFTGYGKVCVDGVTYLQFASGAAVQVNTEGKPVACK